MHTWFHVQLNQNILDGLYSGIDVGQGINLAEFLLLFLPNLDVLINSENKIQKTMKIDKPRAYVYSEFCKLF